MMSEDKFIAADVVAVDALSLMERQSRDDIILVSMGFTCEKNIL